MDSELLAALNDAALKGDIDAAIELGLLDDDVWSELAMHASATLHAWRAERISAMQARERYRAKQAREQRKAEALRRKREDAKQQSAAALPSAAMSALERAKARAAAKRP